MLLLDTSVLIDLQKLALPDIPVVVSAISYAELKFGIEIAQNAQIRRERTARLAWIEDTVAAKWHPFDTAAGDAYGVLAARVARYQARHARSNDIMIASHAYALGARLATLNPDDFRLVADDVGVVVPQARSAH